MQQRQLILLGGALVLLLAIAFLTGVFDSEMSTVNVPVVAIPTDDVHAIQASTSGENVSLEKQDGAWRMTGPVEAPADSSAVARLLADLGALDLQSVVSTSADRHGRYGVDSAGTALTLSWEGGERTLVVGEQGAGFRYVRLEDDDAVYRTNGSVRVPAALDDWRDKTIIDVAPEAIARVSIVGPDRFNVLERSDSRWSLRDAGELMQADSASVQRYLDRFHPLRADGFIETAPEPGDSSFTIRLELSDGSERRFVLTPIENDVAVAGEGAVYRLRGSRLAQIVPDASTLQAN